MSTRDVVYPNGEEVHVGDIIWSNEGSHIRKIIEVVSQKEAKLLYNENDGGILVSRHIGIFDLGGLFFINQQWFKQEWIYPVNKEDMLQIRKMYKLLGKELNINIWGNPYYAYYPVLNIENTEGENEEVWYLFFQPSADAMHSLETEKCYKYNKKKNTFEKPDYSLINDIRGMVEIGGGGCESDFPDSLPE